jgi:hypothetical protein
MQSSPAPASTVHFHATPAGDSAPAHSSSALSSAWNKHRIKLAAAFIILAAGLALRLIPYFGVPDTLSVDEHLYITNVAMVKAVGPFNYPALVQNYVDKQSQQTTVMLPPTRFVFIVLGWAWDTLFQCGPRMALRHVASIFSVLSFLLSGLFAFRLGGARMALTVSALMAVAPLELVMAHRELADGVFAFWALLSLWLLWENLQKPGRLGWLAAYAGSIAAMVLTKENAFFATVAMGGIICTTALFPGLNLGRASWSTLGATVTGGLLGLMVLVSLAGDFNTLLLTYQLLVTKAEKMLFAYETGGGPWFRYIIDIMLLSPAMLLPAIGGIFALRRDNRQGIFLLLFILFSCAVMVNVRNGMNLRYATMWDMPLRYFAAATILHIASGVKRAPVLAAILLLALVGGIELHQYNLIFVQHDVGDPIPQFMLRALEITRKVDM